MFFNSIFWLIERFLLGTSFDQQTSTPEPDNLTPEILEQ
jgi:hypothetical protein